MQGEKGKMKKENRECDITTLRYREKILSILTMHVGEHNAIGMAELFEEVFGESWAHRINDTRKLRKVIKDMQEQSTNICSSRKRNGGGYYIAAVGSEQKAYLDKLKKEGIGKIRRAAKMMRVSLPNYLGQCFLEFGNIKDKTALIDKIELSLKADKNEQI